MAHKLIKGDTQPTIHHFEKGAHWGHSIDVGNETPVKFELLQTYKLSGSIFHYMPIRTGDFVSRAMQSGKIGLFEVTFARQNRLSDLTSFGPDDLYDCTIVFCGYLDESVLRIHDGYGILPPSPIKKVMDNIFDLLGLFKT